MNDTIDYGDYESELYCEEPDMILKRVGSIAITIIGLLGNTLALVVLSRLKEFKKEPLFRYLFIGSTFDVFNLLSVWASFYPNYFFISTNKLACQISYFLFNTTQEFTAYINVVCSIDTYFMVKFPTDYQFRKKIKFQVILLSIIFLVLCLLNVPRYIYMTIEPYFGCTSSNLQIESYLTIANFCIQTLIPVILIIIFSCLTFYELVIKKRRLNRNAVLKNEKNLFRTSMGFNAFFFTCNLPISIIFALSFFSNIKIPCTSLIYDISTLIQAVYYSFDIFIYIASNRIFREYFQSKMACPCRK